MYQTITEASIAGLVDTFYGEVREDRLLGPIFAEAIGDNWKPHLDKMNAFWSSVLLASRTYKGNPMMAHLELPLLTQRHFERWLQLWCEVTVALCSEDVAAIFVARAETIGGRLLHAITTCHEAAHREAVREAI